MIPPELIPFSGNTSEWENYLSELYDVFLETLVKASLQFMGKPITARKNPSYGGKHHSFWHLMSEKGNTGNEEDRIPHLKRCERIAWISHVLLNAENREHILCWKNKRGSRVHVLLYFKQERYVVILDEREDYYILVTAYTVDTDHRHLKLLKEHAASIDPRN